MSKANPENCCNVLLVWDEKSDTYQKYKQYDPKDKPPETKNASEIPGTPERILMALDRLKSALPSPKAIDSAGNISPRKITPHPDTSGKLISDQIDKFDGEPKLDGGPTPTDPVFVEGSGTCIRLGKAQGTECNCQNYSEGDKRRNTNTEKITDKTREEEKEITENIAPTYDFGGYITYEIYEAFGGGGWVERRKDLTQKVRARDSKKTVKVKTWKEKTEKETVTWEKTRKCCE